MVDYCTGDVAPGVFVIVTTDDPIVAEEMTYLKMGDGPYFTLYRPYHLASIEAPLTIAEAVLDGVSSLAPTHWNAEVVAGAKRALKAGESIDGIGGTTVYGVIESAEVTREQRLVPLGLLDGAKVIRDIEVDAVLTLDDVGAASGHHHCRTAPTAGDDAAHRDTPAIDRERRQCRLKPRRRRLPLGRHGWPRNQPWRARR